MDFLLAFLFRLFFQPLVYLSAESKGHYVVLAPTVVRENSPISVAVSTEGFHKDVNYEVTLEKLPESGEKQVLKYVNHSQKSAHVVFRFKPEFSEIGHYRITMQGTGKMELSRAVFTQCNQRRAIIMIQTDKPIYKPGDTVKYRVLVLDHETRPMADLKTVNVQLRDSGQNLVREWPLAKLNHGVFQSQIDLANFIPLGNWTLAVSAKDGQTKEKTFTIGDYFLQNEEIKISCPKKVFSQNKSLEVIVDANYIFGKPIIGKLSVQVDGQSHSKQTQINGRAILSLDLTNATRYDGNEDLFWINITATVKESGTDETYWKIQSIPVYHRSYKITLRKSSEYFLSEVPFRCSIILTDPHGVPFENPDPIEVKVRRTRSWWFDSTDSFTKTPDQNGAVPVMVETTSFIGCITKIVLTVTIAGEKMDFAIEPESDSTTAFFTVSLLTDRPRLNQSMDVEVRSSFGMNLLFYHVIAKGEILASSMLNVWNKRATTFSFDITLAMIPEAAVIVFAMDGNVLRKDVVRFEVHDLRNFVNLTLSKSTAEPHNQISVTARSSPGSMIGLLAIDKRILLQGNGHDISKDTVFSELRHWNSEHQDDDDDDVLKNMGFTLITNAFVPARGLPESTENEQFSEESRFNIWELDDEHQQQQHQHIIIRNKFPETWLWTEMVEVDSGGKLDISDIVPDTMTSWAISAFSLNSFNGLGIISNPRSLTVLKRFFITVNLPYSIVKTEIALVEVFLHNYLDRGLETTVQLLNERAEFQVVNEKNVSDASLELSKKISIASDTIRKVKFFIKPTKSGFIAITVTAESNVAKDAVSHRLKVTPGGLQYYNNFARFIELDESSHRFDNLTLIIPKTVASGSENITFSIEGILLGAALNNLEQLIRLPTGCGEQNMAKLVPSVIALEYMTSAGILTDGVRARAVDYMQKGYQNQLNYKLRDGSFSVFSSDDRGSTFLTALVAKILRFAEKHIAVDRNVIKVAYDWLRDKQNGDGKFTESGRVYYQSLKGGLDGDVSLTAYVLIAFLEHKDLIQQYKSVIDKGTSYISANVNRLKKPYDLALASYALQLADHPNKEYPLDKLLELAKSDASITERWWDSESTSIETAAYALLTYMSRGAYIDAKPIMQWLVSQRYDTGGYNTTQNTFLGLQALAQYSRVMSISRNDYNVTISYGQDRQTTLHMDGKSSLHGKQLTLPGDVRALNIFANGTGAGVFQVAYQYNAPPRKHIPQFRIETTLWETSAADIQTMVVSATFEPQKPEEVTNMVLMEIQFPSGYMVTELCLDRLTRNREVRMFETKDDGTHLVLYFDPLPRNERVGVKIDSQRKAVVLGQIVGWVKVYDYYDPMREAIEYFDYEIQNTSGKEQMAPLELKISKNVFKKMP